MNKKNMRLGTTGGAIVGAIAGGLTGAAAAC